MKIKQLFLLFTFILFFSCKGEKEKDYVLLYSFEDYCHPYVKEFGTITVQGDLASEDFSSSKNPNKYFEAYLRKRIALSMDDECDSNNVFLKYYAPARQIK
jgi:hypothetical protein